MTTDIGITNQALTLLRAETINAFNDESDEAEIASLYYDDFLKDIFSRYPWSFALKKIALVVDATAPVNEYTYAHQLPTDCERIVGIFNSSAVGAKPIKKWERHGNFIHSDEALLWAQYLFIPDESLWPGYFIQYAFHAFATLMAIPITDDDEIMAKWKRVTYGTDEENERGGKFGVAASADAQSTPPKEVGMPDLIIARFA